MKYKVSAEEITVTEWIVEADDEEQAVNKIYAGKYEREDDVDVYIDDNTFTFEVVNNG